MKLGAASVADARANFETSNPSSGTRPVTRSRILKLNWLLLFIPVAIALDWLGANPISGVPCLGVGDRTAGRVDGRRDRGPGPVPRADPGGLLNASLGNAPEIIISLFALQSGLIRMVKSSLTGSIVGNLLFGLGVSMFAGGIKVKTRRSIPMSPG